MSPLTALLARGPGAPPLWRPAPRPGEASWLTDRRREATRWAEGHGFPTTKHEDWRYTRLDDLLEIPFEPAGPASSAAEVADEVAAEVAAGLGPHAGGPRLVFVNGHLVAERPEAAGPAPGAQVGSLARALEQTAWSERLQSLWAPARAGYDHAFRALNDALAADGAFIVVPAGCAVERPIELVFVSASGGPPVLASPRSVVLAGPESQVRVVEVYAGAGEGPVLTNAFTQVVVGPGASVSHYKVQAEGTSSFHLSSLEVRPAEASRFSSWLVALGGRVARHEVGVRLGAPGAAVSLDGLFLPAGSQHHDNPVRVDHMAANCTSHQLYKGIMADQASGVFNGHVVVHEGSLGTDAHQVNKNLLLSEHAQAYTRPRLEIFADDVACTHGAAVGHLDDDALFYLRSRGIPEARARALLVGGFAEEVLARLPAGPLEAYARALVRARLGAEEGSGRPSEAP